jgi:2-succinyl-6-hydroxy-2,4-cyclohexadiene-1-carboxylate synthase
MVIDAPDNYTALVLNSSPVGGGPLDPYAETKNIELIKLYKAGVKNETLCDIWMQGPPDIFTGAKKQAELWAYLKAGILRHTWKELENDSFAIFSGHNQLFNGLNGIKIPVHLLIGEEDMDNIKRCAEMIKRSVKNSTRTYIPNCGHLAILEDPDTCINIMKLHLTA